MRWENVKAAFQQVRLSPWRTVGCVARQAATAYGGLWLAVEASSFFWAGLKDWFLSRWWMLLIAGAVYGLVRGWPRTSRQARVQGRDVSIELRVGDIFDLPDCALVVPSNTTFDTDLDGLIPRSSSVQAGVLQRFYAGDVASLDRDISHALESVDARVEERQAKPGKMQEYPVGTVAHIRRGEGLFYFLASSRISEDGRATATRDTITQAVAGLWVDVASKGDKRDIAVPVLGAGHARVAVTREELVKEIVLSFIGACSGSAFCDRLVIVVRPADVYKHGVDIEALGRFMQAQCEYAGYLHSQGTREGVGMS